MMASGSEVGMTSIEWSARHDTSGYDHSLNILPNQQFTFQGDSISYINALEFPYASHQFSDQGVWSLSDSDHSMTFEGVHQIIKTRYWRFLTGADTSILVVYPRDTLQVLGSITVSDSSVVIEDVNLTLFRNSSFMYNRGF